MASSGSKDLRDVSVLDRASKKPLNALITANLCVFYFILASDGSDFFGIYRILPP